MPFCCGRIDLVKGSVHRTEKGIREMRVCHEVTAVFDDPDLVSCAGLAPVLQLAERAGLARLVAEYVHLERELIRERTIAGLAAAPARGRRGCRPVRMSPAKLRVPPESYAVIARELGLSKTTVRRHLSELAPAVAADSVATTASPGGPIGGHT